MKDGTSGGGLFFLTFCTSAGVCCFTRTKVGIPTLPTFKSPAPFQISKKFNALLVTLKQFIQLFIWACELLGGIAHSNIVIRISSQCLKFITWNILAIIKCSLNPARCIRIKHMNPDKGYITFSKCYMFHTLSNYLFFCSSWNKISWSLFSTSNMSLSVISNI
jgi:hypothetical protein